MFINFTNHMSANWAPAQLEAARAYGDVVDLPFPAVSPSASINDVDDMANEYTDRILQMNPSAVMCQGEFTLTYAVVSKLISRGITVVAACSERRVVERLENGIIHKSIEFEFEQFREYCG